KVRMSQRNFTGAAAFFREALAIGPNNTRVSWERFATQSELGASLLSRSEFVEAEPLLLRGYQGLVDRAAAIPWESRPALDEAGRRIIRLYRDWGKPDKEAEWQQKLLGGSSPR